MCVQRLYASGHACIRLGRLIYDHFSLFVGFVKCIKVRVISVQKKKQKKNKINESCFSVEMNPNELKQSSTWWFKEQILKTDKLVIVVAFHKITLLLCLKPHLSKNVRNTLLAGVRTSFKMPDIVQFGLYVGCQGQWNLRCVCKIL